MRIDRDNLLIVLRVIVTSMVYCLCSDEDYSELPNEYQPTYWRFSS